MSDITPDSGPTEDGFGWTKAEFDRCPELAARLHRRILDLEDALTEAVGICSGGRESHSPLNVKAEAWRAVLREGERFPGHRGAIGALQEIERLDAVVHSESDEHDAFREAVRIARSSLERVVIRDDAAR